MQRRQGFTIIEMLVSMALIIFIMTVLSEAFVAALESFRQLKAVGDMDEKTRSATTLLVRDLRADHFGGTNLPLSAQTLPPGQGYFRVYQGSASTFEGTDPDNVLCSRAVDHMIAFTINLGYSTDPQIKADRRENFMTTNLAGSGSPLLSPPYTPAAFQDNPPTFYYGQWAEVAWFLRATNADANGNRLFGLFRRQVLIVPGNGPTSVLYNQNQLGPTYTESGSGSYGDKVSVGPSKDANGVDQTGAAPLYFNSPNDVAAPCRRFGMQRLMSAGPLNYNQAASAGLLATTDPITNTPTYPIVGDGSDLILTNVVSFDVKISFGNESKFNGEFLDLFSKLNNINPYSQYTNNNPAFPTASGPYVYDTWCSGTNPGYYDYSTWATPGTFTSMPTTPSMPPVKAIQIILRVWDPKTETTRQVTVVQNL